MDTSQYEVEYEDGEIEVITANIIAENILTQVDDEGRQQMLMDEIIDYRIKDDTVPMSEGTYKTPTGAIMRLKTTKGWELYIKWKDGSANWVALKDLKNYFPVELADYALA